MELMPLEERAARLGGGRRPPRQRKSGWREAGSVVWLPTEEPVAEKSGPRVRPMRLREGPRTMGHGVSAGAGAPVSLSRIGLWLPAEAEAKEN